NVEAVCGTVLNPVRDSPPAALEAGPGIVPEVVPGTASEPSSGNPANAPQDRPRERSQDRPEPSLRLAASKSSKMTPDDLAPHVEAMLAKYGDKAVTLAR